MAQTHRLETDTLVRPDLAPVDEALVAEFIRHLQTGAQKARLSPARFLMVPENRAQLGVFLPEQTSRDLIVHNLGQVADVPTIHTPMRFVEAEVTPYTRKSERTNGESQARERITTGWDIAPATAINQPIVAIPSNWEVDMEPIRVRAPRVVADRPVPVTERGLRAVSSKEVVKYTGLTEVQFEVQMVLGKAHAITEGCLEAIPVVLPRWNDDWAQTRFSWVDDTFYIRDPMLLRFNRDKLTRRLGPPSDMGEEMVRQINGLSGQAVHFGIQALAEANIGRYLAARLNGQMPQIDVFMKERIGLLHSSARAAMVAYESLISQALTWSAAGVNVLSPREYVFAAEATASFFDGVSAAGEFMAHDTGRLAGVLKSLKSDLRDLGWRGK